MKLTVLGSSSKGNGYLLTDSEGYTLILEAGIKLAEVKQKLNFDLSKVVGVFVSHEHGDHAKYLDEYAGAGINVYVGLNYILDRIKNKHRIQIIPTRGIQAYPFMMKVFPVQHDVPCNGLLIRHMETQEQTLFITDTFHIPYSFPKINHFIVEANYDIDIVRNHIANGTANLHVISRVYESHMEIENTLAFLSSNVSPVTESVTLIHLSDSNSDARDFKLRAEKTLGKVVQIADIGDCISLGFD